MISENAKLNLKLDINFAHVNIFLLVVKKCGQLVKIRKIAIRLNLEHNFLPNMVITIEDIKQH